MELGSYYAPIFCLNTACTSDWKHTFPFHHWPLFDSGILFARLKTSLRKLNGEEYLCHKWPRICSTCHKYSPVLSSFMTYHRVCKYINTTGATSDAGTAYRSPRLVMGFVLRELYFYLYICFVDRCLSFCAFLFGHFVICFSSIYGFWLQLWYLQALLSIPHMNTNTNLCSRSSC